jgi:hypothetical protein
VNKFLKFFTFKNPGYSGIARALVQELSDASTSKLLPESPSKQLLHAEIAELRLKNSRLEAERSAHGGKLLFMIYCFVYIIVRY